MNIEGAGWLYELARTWQKLSWGLMFLSALSIYHVLPPRNAIIMSVTGRLNYIWHHYINRLSEIMSKSLSTFFLPHCVQLLDQPVRLSVNGHVGGMDYYDSVDYL